MLFILKPPLPSLPNEENTNKFQCWGVGEDWLLKPWRDAQVHKTRTGLPNRGQWMGSLKERYSNTKVTVEHNTAGEGGRAEIKKRSQVGSALSSPGSPGVWGWFRAAGQVSVELLGQWAVGVGRGRAGRSQGEVGTDRLRKVGLHIPLLLGNERPIVLRNHVLSQVQLFRVILVAQSPVPIAILTGLRFIHSEVGPFGVLVIFGVGSTHLAFAPSTALLLFFFLIAAPAQWASLLFII